MGSGYTTGSCVNHLGELVTVLDACGVWDSVPGIGEKD
jgi:hypothetical protein